MSATARLSGRFVAAFLAFGSLGWVGDIPGLTLIQSTKSVRQRTQGLGTQQKVGGQACVKTR